MNINNIITNASRATPDPERAFKNLERLLLEAPDIFEKHGDRIEGIAGLFAYSQFLADYCISNPASLSRVFMDLHKSIDKQKILSESHDTYAAFHNENNTQLYKLNAMKLLREIKKYYLLIITMKDISGVASLNECVSELSVLSEALLELALDMSFTLMRRKFGLMRENAFSIIGMGKLGARELNYSSDIDIITVYRSEESISTGILNPFGIRYNKISAHEYFCTLTEVLTNLLQSPTEDGIAHRIDLRLRPNGQKGPPSLSLDSYRSYYESWGKTWERIALIRARPVAGDNITGGMFIDSIEPFVWKRSLDYNDIDEIRELKKKIDSIFDTNDIKRGYGGIREIEFFAQTFQLLYGGENKLLRQGTIPAVLDELSKEGLLTGDEARTLSGSYIFLRRIEHILQMKDDLQTYSLPTNPGDFFILSKKMQFENEKEFASELRLKRLKVRDMYNSLLGGTDAAHDVLLTLKDELPDNAILDYLSFKGFKKPDMALKNISAIMDQMSVEKTVRERALLRKTVPVFLEQAVKSINKDRVLDVLVTFIRKIGNHESYIDLLFQRNDTREMLVNIFSTSTYFTRLLLGLENLEGIFEYPDIRQDIRLYYKSLQERLTAMLKRTADPLSVIREFKVMEELKTGMLYLKRSLDVYGLSHALSMLAEIIIKATVHHLGINKGFAVIGFGGFGAGELNIGSDLDLIFIRIQDNGNRANKTIGGRINTAEELIRFLTEYTANGYAYKVDMRLRPDGSKGILVNDIEGYKNYYLKSAHPWEIQSLLRARPVAGDINLTRTFQRLRRQIIIQRGKEISGADIKDMRKRIIHEISLESSGYDIKNGPGGIKEIEFLIQYLQLKHASRLPSLIAHNTVTALKKLEQHTIIDKDSAGILFQSHKFLKTLDTLLRLNEEDLVKTNSEVIDIIIQFLNFQSRDELFDAIENTRHKVIEITKRFYG